MIECPIYLNTDITTTASPLPKDDVACGCNCGYIQYESLIPYLAEIRDSLNLDQNQSIEFEFKLREQVAEISRLFDSAAGVTQGYFSKAHYRTTKLYSTNGGKYIKVPLHIAGTLEVRTLDDVLIDSSNYSFQDEHLIYMPCEDHIECGCSDICGNDRLSAPIKWPSTCYKITAKWGRECADLAVQMAVRDYLIERYRMQDPVIQLANGISVQRRFQVPHSWETYLRNFRSKREIFSNFAIA